MQLHELEPLTRKLNEAALAAIEYPGAVRIHLQEEEARALLKDEDPDVVCFPPA